jgi:DNA-binding NarL/FixJ family response regulator
MSLAVHQHRFGRLCHGRSGPTAGTVDAQILFFRARAAPPSSPMASHSLLILCHEAPLALRWREQLLGRPGLAVQGFTNSPTSARQLIAQHGVDLVLMELGLMASTTNGAIHGLRGGPHADLPHVLVVGQRLDDPLLLQALRGGADAYFVPGSGSLADAVQRTLDGESPIEPALARQVLHLFDSAAPTDPASALAETPLQLTGAERKLLMQVVRGDSLEFIAEAETMSLNTLGLTVRGIYRKLRWLLRAGALSLEGGTPGGMLELQIRPPAGRNR